MVRYAVVIEPAGANYSGYVPDLPCCIATGDSIAIAQNDLRIAIRLHIEGLTEDGLPVAPPAAVAECLDA
jgi:predicted RNase H-like HicB family nuclease